MTPTGFPERALASPRSGALFPRFAVLVSLAALALPAPAAEVRVVVTLQNLSAEELFLSSPWIGFQDGEFDVYDGDSGPSAGLAHLVATGSAGELEAELVGSGRGRISTVLPVPGQALAAGGRTSRTLLLASEDPGSRFLVFAATLGGTDGGFIACENPLAYPVFDDDGAFTGTSFLITGNDLLWLSAGGKEEVAGPSIEGGSLDGAEEPGGAETELSGTGEDPFDGALGAADAVLEEAVGGSPLEVIRITVAAAPPDSWEEPADLPAADTAEAGASGRGDPQLERGRGDGAPDGSAAGEAAEGRGAEDDARELEDLDLDRWQRYTENLEGEIEDAEESEAAGG